MSLYYDGDLEKDLKNIKDAEDSDYILLLNDIGKGMGYGRAQQILQVLWAEDLRKSGYPTSGALFR